MIQKHVGKNEIFQTGIPDKCSKRNSESISFQSLAKYQIIHKLLNRYHPPISKLQIWSCVCSTHWYMNILNHLSHQHQWLFIFGFTAMPWIKLLEYYFGISLVLYICIGDVSKHIELAKGIIYSSIGSILLTIIAIRLSKFSSIYKHT